MATAATTGLAENELLAVVRAGGWRFALPLRKVARVLSAAMPVKVPAGERSAFVVRLGDELVPLDFGAALFGADEVVLGLEDKMVVLALPGGPRILWVEAVEDVVPFAPAPDGERPPPWVACFTGGEATLAVVDVDALAHDAPGGDPPA